MTRVEVQPELLQWARNRARVPREDLIDRFPKLPEWERGDWQPTLKQLEGYAKKTHTPIGYFFLPEPPVEDVPIPDLRTIGLEGLRQPSPDLLDTIYVCQQRQEWYRDFARASRRNPLDFVGSASLGDDASVIARRIRDELEFDITERAEFSTWTQALRESIRQADAAGILVMVNGVVGNNNYRKLDPEEFRGFALSDEYAPLVFINGSDTKAAQMFTLAHELAHIWLGRSALSDVQAASKPEHSVERWCNQVAAEVLVPLDALERAYRSSDPLQSEMERLARVFKVSTLVILRRIHDAGGLTEEQMWHEFRRENARLKELSAGGRGGNFYNTLTSRVGNRFAQALVESTLEGQTLRRDALRMLGISKLETFHKLGQRMGVA